MKRTFFILVFLYLLIISMTLTAGMHQSSDAGQKEMQCLK
jgi:hypothetical protein